MALGDWQPTPEQLKHLKLADFVDMTRTDTLSTLQRMSRCKGKAILYFNTHREYESMKDWNEVYGDEDFSDWIGGKETFDEACRREECVFASLYPQSIVGHYSLKHYDLNVLMEKVAEILDREGIN